MLLGPLTRRSPSYRVAIAAKAHPPQPEQSNEAYQEVFMQLDMQFCILYGILNLSTDCIVKRLR